MPGEEEGELGYWAPTIILIRKGSGINHLSFVDFRSQSKSSPCPLWSPETLACECCSVHRYITFGMAWQCAVLPFWLWGTGVWWEKNPSMLLCIQSGVSACIATLDSHLTVAALLWNKSVHGHRIYGLVYQLTACYNYKARLNMKS